MKVEDLVGHVLYHTNAEAATRDPSQVAGVAARAQYVRDILDGFRADTRDMTLDDVLGEISNAASLSVLQASFQRSITNTRTEGDTRPQLAIQAWVGQARE